MLWSSFDALMSTSWQSTKNKDGTDPPPWGSLGWGWMEKRRREKGSQDKHLKLHCLTEDEIWPGQTNPFISTLGSGPRPSPWGTEILCLQWPALCWAQSKFLYRLIMNEWVHANSWFCLSQGHCPHLWFSPLASSPISLARVSVRARNQEGNYRPIKASPWPITECKQLWAWDSSFQLNQASSFIAHSTWTHQIWHFSQQRDCLL